MATIAEKCQTCGSDVIIRRYDGEMVHYEPCCSVEDADKIYKIKKAINQYFLSLDRREHGGVAESEAFQKIQDLLGMHWEQGKMLKLLEERPGMKNIYDT